MLQHRRMRWLLASLALGLAACTPEYDWRELDVADGRARAAFPARPVTEQRPVLLAGTELPFTLTMARKERFVFAVGHTVLPAGDAAAANALAHALMQSWYVNTGANPPAAAPELGQTVDLVSSVRGVSLRFMARAIVQDGALIEAIVTGPTERFPQAPAEEFLQSLRPRPTR